MPGQDRPASARRRAFVFQAPDSFPYPSPRNYLVSKILSKGSRDSREAIVRQEGAVIIYLIVGGIIGWLASIVMRTDAQQGIILNIVVGIVGSFIGGVLFGSNLGTGGLMGWIGAFAGAVILLAIVNMVRRGRLR